jgi:hypothetical protein
MRPVSADMCVIEAVPALSKTEVISPAQALPAPGQRVIAVCREFRVLGFRDEQGIWREERHPDNALKDVLGWQELGLAEQYACQVNSSSYVASITFGRL